MSLKEELNNDLKEAMKNKDKLTLSVIRMAKAAISNQEIADGKELTDTDLVGVLAKEVKQRQDTLVEVKKVGRDDLVQAAQNEINILQKYLPEPLSDEQIQNLIKNVIEKTNANSIQDLGKVMGMLQSQIKGRADGSKVSQLVKDLLNK
jgi:uncharacterized protein YqeY